MVRSRDVVQAEGSARTEGARRATGVRADGAAAGAGSLAPGQRWSASRKRDVVLRLLRGESLEALSREAGVEIYRLDAWRERAMGWPRTRLKGSSRRASGGGARRGEASHRGTVDGDRAAPRAGPGRGAAPPFGDAEVATMSATTSAATGRCFGIQRVCQVWERSRSALYARRARAHHRLGAGPARRGPPPRQSDAQLLAAIRTDLARSPFHGEGHRKVHARLRILDGIRVARTRVLRVMRAHGTALPAPRASGRREDPRREGHHPGAQRDVGDGRRAGIHARRRVGLDLRGSRTLERGVRGVARVQSRESLRGTRSDCARARTSLWFAGRRCRPRAGASDGPRQSVSVRPLPQADPVLGDPPQFRLCRGTGNERGGGAVESHAQEQAIHGRIFQNLEAVRVAVADFVERYNQTWRLEKLGYHTPIEAREEYVLRQAA